MTVNGKLTNVHFGATFEEAPLVIASLASCNGADTSSPWIGAVTARKCTAMALEDQPCDIETNHGYEILDWMAFSQAGTIYEAAPELALSVADPSRTVAETGFAEASGAAVVVGFGSYFERPVVIGANQKWAAETFTADFDAPGVVAGMASRNGADAAAARDHRPRRPDQGRGRPNPRRRDPPRHRSIPLDRFRSGPDLGRCHRVTGLGALLPGSENLHWVDPASGSGPSPGEPACNDLHPHLVSRRGAVSRGVLAAALATLPF